MTVLSKSEIAVIHGGVTAPDTICLVAEVLHLGCEGINMLQRGVYKDWPSLAARTIEITYAGVLLSAAAINLEKLFDSLSQELKDFLIDVSAAIVVLYVVNRLNRL